MFQLQPNTLLDGRYLIQEIIGEGGMGIVYSALDQEAGGRDCALKILKEPHSSKKSRQRFEEEIRCVRKLRSPHIVQVYDTGETGIEHGARQYVVMELVDGVPLSQLLKSEPLGAERAAYVALGVTSALQVAHREGVVHRDLKPANIVVGDLMNGGVVKILDFGIAKDLSREETLNLTRTGMLVGTPTYMSPERFQIDEPLTPAADLYSVGLLLYNMIHGRPPVYVKHPALPPEIRRLPAPLQVCWLHVNHVPPLLTGCPDSLAELTHALLAKEPKSRPDATETRARLSEVLATEYGEQQEALTESLPNSLFDSVLAQYTTAPLLSSEHTLHDPSSDLETPKTSLDLRPQALREEAFTGTSEGLEEPAPSKSSPLPPSHRVPPPSIELMKEAAPEQPAPKRGFAENAQQVNTLMLKPDDMVALNKELSRLVEEDKRLSSPPPQAQEGHGPAVEAYLAHLHTRSTLRLDSDDPLAYDVKLHTSSEPLLPFSSPSSEAQREPSIRLKEQPQVSSARLMESTLEVEDKNDLGRWLIPVISLITGALISYLFFHFK